MDKERLIDRILKQIECPESANEMAIRALDIKDGLDSKIVAKQWLEYLIKRTKV